MTNQKPVFVATHPRACSTAFERVFMTRRDILQCVHEPFGDAYYFGPERLAERYEDDEKARVDSGYSESTYETIMEEINRGNTKGKRILIKDMAQYFIPPGDKPVSIAPSFLRIKRGVGTNDDSLSNGHNDPDHASADHIVTGTPSPQDGKVNADKHQNPTTTEPGNPTVMPKALLEQFHFAFLIRHPRNSIPSYYRCCIPPLDCVTGFHNFRNDEAGYSELRKMFDYLRAEGLVGPRIAGQDAHSHTHANGTNGTSTSTNGNNITDKDSAKKPSVDICVIDADDLLDNPPAIIEAFCKSVDIAYTPDMLNWPTDEDHQYAKDTFEKWRGFHDDAINSRDLKPRTHKSTKTNEQYQAEWVEKYGEKGAQIIRKAVEENVADYEYLKQFAIKV